MEHIALATEGAFVGGTLVTLASAIEATADPQALHFHVFSDRRSFGDLERKASRFWCGFATRGAKLSLHELDASQLGMTGYGCPRKCARGVFAEQLRIFLPMLLPDVEKVLWMDSDGIVLGDAVALSRSLFTGVNAERSIAGVLRKRKPLESMLGLTEEHVNTLGLSRLSGMPGFGPSINAGFLAVNLRVWRARGTMRHVQQLIARLKRMKLNGFKGMSTVSDTQTPIIMVCTNYAPPHGVQSLDPSWNVDGLGFKKIDQTVLSEGRYLHWSGEHKPWNAEMDAKVRYARLWKPFERRVLTAQAQHQSGCEGLRIHRSEGAT